MEHHKKLKQKRPKQLILTKADKRNILVLLYKDDYNNKIEEFLTKTILQSYPTTLLINNLTYAIP
jgi:hypothetical protein